MSKLDELRNKVQSIGASLKRVPDDAEDDIPNPVEEEEEELELDFEEPKRGFGALFGGHDSGDRPDPVVHRRRFGANLEPKQRLKAIYITGVAMIALVAVIALVYAVLFSQDARFERELERGQQYLENNQYQQAIDSYDVVLKIDESYTAAYISRAEAYAGINDYTNAERDYQKALELDSTNYDVYLALANVQVSQSRTDDAIRTLQNGYNETKYAPIYDMMFELKSRAGNTAISGYVNHTSNGVAAEGASGAKLTLYDRDLQRDMAISYTDADGGFTVAAIAGNYTLTIEATDCLVFTYDFSIAEGEIINMERVLLIAQQDAQGAGSIQVAMSDASTSNAKSGVAINLRSGWDKTEGEYVFDTPVYTNENGIGVLGSVPSGYYTIEYSCNGYITTTANIAISTGDTIYINHCICEIMPENQAKVVLTWGAGVTDLDLHVCGIGETKEDIHIYYGTTSYNDGTTVRLLLDCKESEGYGPEAVSLLGGVVGEGYTVYVFDYDNRSQDNSDKLSNCEAVIRIYVGDHLEAEVKIPMGNTGIYWYACTIGPDWTVTPINTFSNAEQ